MMRQKSLHVFAKKEAFLLAGASMFLGLFVSLFFQGLIADIENNILFDRLIIILGELAILIPPYFILKQRGFSLDQVLPLKPITSLSYLMAIILVVGTIGLVSIFEIIIIPYFPVPDFLIQMEANLVQGNFGETLLLVIAGSLIAPIVEESIFRGILQHSLFYRYGTLLPAMIIPTIIFALFHVAYLFYLPALIELIFLALLLAWLMAKTGNILIPMMVHGLFNLSSFSSLSSTGADEMTSLGDLSWTWIILSLVFSALGWLYFKKIPVVVFDEVYLIPPAREEDI